MNEREEKKLELIAEPGQKSRATIIIMETYSDSNRTMHMLKLFSRTRNHVCSYAITFPEPTVCPPAQRHCALRKWKISSDETARRENEKL